MMRNPFPHSNFGFPQVKICGLTRLSDAIVCAESGINAIGINFWPKSKRYHAFSDAARWLQEVPESLTRVAVFVNAPAAEVMAIMMSGLLDVAQFHGDESDDYVQTFLDAGMAVICALSVRTDEDFEKIARSQVKTILLDAYQAGVYGGTGQTCDWTLAARAVQMFPEKQIILSGGLTPRNVAQAIREVKPAAVDLASGVETAPAIKSADLIRELVKMIDSTHK